MFDFVVTMLFQIQMVHADDGELCAQEHSEGIYQTVKIKPVPLPRLSNMPLNPLVPPKTVSQLALPMVYVCDSIVCTSYVDNAAEA